MSIRNIEGITIEEAIIHIVDTNGDEPILNNITLDLDDELYEFASTHIMKIIKDEANKKAKFKDDSVFRGTVKRFFSGELDFVECSKEMAEKLFMVAKEFPDIPSGDLMIVKFSANNEKFLGILKMDYQRSYIHDIGFEEEGFKISIITQDIGLPSERQRLANAAILKDPHIDENYDALYVNKVKSSESEEAKDYFVNRYLNIYDVIDNRDRTKIFKNVVEKWARKNVKEDVHLSLDIREKINESLLEKEDLSIAEFSNEVLKDDIDLKQSLITSLEGNGLDVNNNFEVDKKWVEKKLKKKSIKTDTGFTISSELDIFKDSNLIEVVRNGDGTVNYVIKNVRNILEK
ncbi:MAG: nucleoid-associated protein [Firmicutes bacterium]|jgi:nucleoid-associated protein YejK|nr:nucleoid-associated protein [Bacillota bacterium]